MKITKMRYRIFITFQDDGLNLKISGKLGLNFVLLLVRMLPFN